ncbi:tetratricopeptide repeat protein [Streptomyces sp. CA-288835]|uniref:tetratricopeptide repeat protein n=1 Tax=Streptomyces sp. CA-288835 TaxID=3240069 RepID=UPI003D94433E
MISAPRLPLPGRAAPRQTSASGSDGPGSARSLRVCNSVAPLGDAEDHARNVGEAGQRREAARLLAEVVPDYVRVLGSDRPETPMARNDHVYYLGEAGERAEAARLLAEMVLDYVRVLGPDRPETLRARRDHAPNVGEGHRGASPDRAHQAVHKGPASSCTMASRSRSRSRPRIEVPIPD